MAGSRTLILVRHAKSSWSDPGLRDHDRPLNKRGARDAPRMARRLAERGDRPDLIVTSSAARALATAQAFAAELGLPTDAISVRPELYGAGTEEILELIGELDDAVLSVLLVGHNPTFTELAHELGDAALGHLPTCGVVTLGADLASWSDVEPKGMRLADFDFPKKDAG